MSAWKEYDVTLTLRLSIGISFSRDTEAELTGITKANAIANAIDSLPFDIEKLDGAGWAIALPIDGEAEEL